jgi:hypothetical protein
MTAFKAWASPAGQIGNDPKPPDLAVRWHDVERQVFATFAAVCKRRSGAFGGGIAACYSQHRDADYFSSQLDLLGNGERVVDLDAEVSDGALELRMPEQS